MNEPSIRVMPKALAEQIAAGEVVERPASAAKELLENALDAGAEHITLELRRGGIEYLRVTDDGKGIPAEEVPTAFLRHATSKLYDEAQLSAISTLGFRGEALAAIGAVARVEMLTKPRDALLGCRYIMDNGETHEYERSGCPNGTTVIVRDLFAQVPARYKFLKKDSAEGSAIHAMVQRLSLSHPEVSFRLIRDGKTILHTPGDGDLMSAVVAAVEESPKNLVRVRGRDGELTVSGFLSRPSCCKGSRQGQFFFVNGRWVRTGILIAALENAYKNQKMVGRFPGCVLRLEVPYGEVDVNSHPAKTEVRFADEQRIYRLVYHAAQNALADAEDAPELDPRRGGKTPGLNPLSETLPLSSPTAAPWTGRLPAGGFAPRPTPPGEKFSTFPSTTSTFFSSSRPASGEISTKGAETPRHAGKISTIPTGNVENRGETAPGMWNAVSDGDVRQAQGPTDGAAAPVGVEETPRNGSPRRRPVSPGELWAVPAPTKPAAEQLTLLEDGARPDGKEEPGAAFPASDLPTSELGAAPLSTAPKTAQKGDTPRENVVSSPESGAKSPENVVGPRENPSVPPQNPCEGDAGCGSGVDSVWIGCGREEDNGTLNHFPSPYVTAEGREPWRVVCELFHTYIVVEQGEKAIFIDKHAAHERIGFERLKSRQWLPMSQELLQPQAIAVSPQQKTVLLEQVGNLDDFGFTIQDFGENTLVLRAIPDFLTVEEAPAALEELADEILTHGSADPRAARDSLLHSMACKAAMKAGQRNSPAELFAVARAVMSGEIKHCPHGRPVMTVLGQKELEKAFKRIL